jgi:hypothetical protein
MFEKDLLKDGPTSHLFQCGWYLDYPKDNTFTLGVPLRESIKRLSWRLLQALQEHKLRVGGEKMLPRERES